MQWLRNTLQGDKVASWFVPGLFFGRKKQREFGGINTMAETGLTKNQILSQLSKSPHGKLREYVDVGAAAAIQEAEFLAHLIAWDRMNGQIRDAKVALPVVSLMAPKYPEELVSNSLAHIGLLGPRELLRAYRFALEVRPVGRMRKLHSLVENYLRAKESDRKSWNRLALQHRKTLKELYALAHIKPSADADAILFKGFRPAGSVFEAVARLKDLPPAEAASEIVSRKIPFLIAMGALGAKAKDTALLLALIGRMSATELVTNTKMLEKMGMKFNPALRGAYEEALQKAASSKANVLKTTRAAEAVEDEGLKEKLRGLQDKQLQSMGVEGNWLVLGDKSGSMQRAIDIAKQIAATLAKMVMGKVWLVFFDTQPQTLDVTDTPLDAIQKATRYIRANGGTSIGCGLQRMLEAKEEIDGIAIVSDGGENSTPYFSQVYPRYAAFAGKEPTVYLYHCGCRDLSFHRMMKIAGIDMQVIDIDESIDFYSLPNLVSTMRTNRYSLVDEVMATKLLKLEDVFDTMTEKEAA
jgi:hypothetical protein